MDGDSSSPVNPDTMSMTQDVSVTATFEQSEFDLLLLIQTIYSCRRCKVKRQWTITGMLVWVVVFALVVRFGQAKGPGPQEQTQTSFQGPALHNQGLGVASAKRGHNKAQSEAANLVSGRHPFEGESMTGRPTGLFSYQGQLLQDGSPVNSTTAITFSLYTTSTESSAWWQEVQTVDVEHGLFNVMLGAVNPLDDLAFMFQSQIWLEIQPQGAAAPLTPRQPLGAVGYAMNLMPGATLVDENVGGLYGATFYVESDEHAAIHGRSHSDDAVSGRSYYTGTAGVRGQAYGPEGVGVYGYASTDSAHGVVGVQAGYDRVDDGGSFWAPGGFFGGRNGIIGSTKQNSGHGVIGLSMSSAGVGNGVYARSANYDAVYARTDRDDHNYGLYTLDNIYSLNYNLAGAVMHVVQNGGKQALEPGDVVIFSGMAAPLEAGGPPVVQVARATEANSTAVAGVVYSRFNIRVATKAEQSNSQGSGAYREVTPLGPVQPGEHLLLVVQGPAQVKASALAGAIQPGDLMSSAGEIGYAAQAAEISIEGVKTAMPGAIFGKALEALETGQKLIYVFVTLQ